MEIHFVFVGKTGFSDIDRTIQRYVERINRFIHVRLHIIKEERITKDKTTEVVLKKEAEKILDLVGKKRMVISWDMRGRQISSEDYAKLLNRWEEESIDGVWMVVGGPLGIDTSVLRRSNIVLSLSPMIFPHDLARVIVVEQTYRAYTIIKGIPYHK